MRIPRVPLLLLTAGLLAIASKPRRPRLLAQRIVRISRVVSDLDRSEAFYRDALGFHTVARGPSDAAALTALGLGNNAADEVVMQLGEATVALVRFARPGRPYPSDCRANDLWFQHMAIVVRDMDAAYAHLKRIGGWQPISEDGPNLLPPANGSVRAFKFRDPDGHPLELIWFPNRDGGERLFQTVDHSALSVSSTARALNFYRALGFRVKDRSLNTGEAQDKLDGLEPARVRVTGLRPAVGAGPGVELLGYLPPGRSAGTTQANDVVTDWMTIAVKTLFGEVRRAERDPDGHRMMLLDQGSGLPA